MGLTGAIWHDDSYLDEGLIDAEAFVCLSQPIPGSETVQVYPRAGHLMASVVHHGPLQTITFAYSALVSWMDQAGYQMAGPNRELYIHYSLPANPADPTYVTELQFPVERR
jgi:effector-binding domain-containing protein